MSNFDRDDYCFVCGPQNPIGLKLSIEKTEKGARTQYTAKKEHQGFKNILHGGITATLLDEVMVWSAFLHGYPVVTLSLQINYHKPIQTGQNLTVEGELKEIGERRIVAESRILHDGKLMAKGSAILLRVNTK